MRAGGSEKEPGYQERTCLGTGKEHAWVLGKNKGTGPAVFEDQHRGRCSRNGEREGGSWGKTRGVRQVGPEGPSRLRLFFLVRWEVLKTLN